MKYQSKCVFVLLSALIILGLSGISEAVLYDQNVTPDVIFGSGNGNGYFVTDTANNIEVGLRAKVPYAGVYNSDGAGTYNMSSGPHPKWGDPGAAWNFEFSVNVNQDGTGNSGLADFDITLSIDMDPGLGQSWISFNPFTTFTDNALGDNSTPNGGGDDSATANANYGNYSVGQNSMNIGWLTLPFDNMAPGTYDFQLSVSHSVPPLAQTYMTVVVDGGGAPVPEPSTLLLLGGGLVGIYFMKRKN